MSGSGHDLNMTRTCLPVWVRNMPGDVTVTGVHFQACLRSCLGARHRPMPVVSGMCALRMSGTERTHSRSVKISSAASCCGSTACWQTHASVSDTTGLSILPVLQYHCDGRVRSPHRNDGHLRLRFCDGLHIHTLRRTLKPSLKEYDTVRELTGRSSELSVSL